jgi:hypothetical protein
VKKLLRLAAVAACLAVPALSQTAKSPVTGTLHARTLPPCSQACCFGEINASTECSYYSPNYGFQPYSQCYWWWTDGGVCSAD